MLRTADVIMLPVTFHSVLCAKGIERETGRLMSDIAARNHAGKPRGGPVGPELRDRRGGVGCRPPSRWPPRAPSGHPIWPSSSLPRISGAIRPPISSASRSAGP